MTDNNTTTPFIDDNDQTRARQSHLDKIRELTGNAYPNKFRRSNVTQNSVEGEDTITAIVEKFKHHEPPTEAGARPTPEQLEAANAALRELGDEVRVSGRLAVPPRVMGKAAFVHLSDGKERLQVYVRRDDVQPMKYAGRDDVDGWELFQLLDHGDFIGVEGFLFVTKTGELSVHVRAFEFLAKALLPMPDKLHGISDPEIRQRQRYADLIAGSLKIDKDADATGDAAESAGRELSTREVFERRSKIISEMRRFLDARGYLEVETPMLTPIASGAAARPFKTHHNALDIDLYARIAPELYLKRLLVGGFERVYELNRNFRNEGISARHNPEFTMLEFYCAYMDVNGMMDLCEELLRESVIKAMGGTRVRFGDEEIDFSSFARMTMKDAIYKSEWFIEAKELDNELLENDALDNPSVVRRLSLLSDSLRVPTIDFLTGELTGEIVSTQEKWQQIKEHEAKLEEPDEAETAEHIENIFSTRAEFELIQPTFIIDYPKSISPLSKASPDDPSVAERFELFIAGMECANGFSELNDPVEQYERFREQGQARERGDDEAMQMDTDYVRALSYGMPPAAGIGIGIDRLVMLLTNRRSIRDVILFPHLRPAAPKPEEAAEVETPAETEE